MPSPVGHGLMGVAIYSATVPRRRALHAWGFLGLCVGFSLLPDLDFVAPMAVGRFDWAQEMHRSFTHTVFFALAAGLVWLAAARLIRPRSAAARWSTAAVIVACLLAHLALDVMNVDTKAPFGVSMFWPVWDKWFYAPIGLLPSVAKRTYGDIISWHNVTVALTELAVFGALILVVVGVRLAIGRRRATCPARESLKERA
jgi:inner membrane protein